MKKLAIYFLILLLMFTVTVSCLGEGVGIGYQVTRPASGFSIKIPVKDNFYLQPTFSYSVAQKPESINGHLAFGVRGIDFLPTRGDFHPYMGLSWGYSENFSGSTLETTSVTKGGNGYEAFMGIEYQKYALRPALEIGMGTMAKVDGSYYAGAIVNCSLIYYF